MVCKIVNLGGSSYQIYRLRQTLSSAAELDAAPEYVNTKAYDELRNRSYAFKLPFDLYHTEAKAYLDRFGINRAAMMKAFRVGSDPAEVAIAAESLGLTAAERTIITTAPAPNSNAAQQAFWNVPAPGNVVDYMRQVAHFLDKTKLNYRELELLLQLKFIDPAGNLFIQHNDLSCDTEQKEIANFDLAASDRIHRFLRLQKKIGWPYEVLDEIISQPGLGNGQLNDTSLVKAEQIKEISEKTGLKTGELTGCFGTIPHLVLQEGNPLPLYHQTFLNKAKNGLVDEGMLPERVDGTQSISTYTSYISTCLQLKQQDLEILLPLLPDSMLSFANLSYLLAASRLLKKLKLSAADFGTLIDLSAIDLTSSPDAMLALIELHEQLKHSPLKIADVRFLLRHEAPDLSGRNIKEEKIEDILNRLKTAYKAIGEQWQSKYDANLSAAE